MKVPGIFLIPRFSCSHLNVYLAMSIRQYPVEEGKMIRKLILLFIIVLWPLFFTGPSLAGVTVAASVTTSANQGKCPIGVTVHGKISSTQAGMVSYEYVLSSGVKLPGTLQFDKPGTQEISAGFVAGAPSLPQYPLSGWAAINIIDFWDGGQTTPGSGMSNKAYWNVTCQNPDLAVTEVTWTPCPLPNNKAPQPLGSVLFKYKNQGTGPSGPYTLLLTCEGVPGTAPFGQTPSCPEGIFPKTMPFSSGMAAGEAGQTGVIGGSCNMPPKWGGGKYRITAQASLNGGSSDELGKTDNNQKTLEIEVPWVKLTDVLFMTVEGNKYKGACSANKNTTILNGKIAGNGYGVIKYQWVIDGVPSSSISEMTYHVDDILNEVSVTSIPMEDKTGTGAIKIISPVQKQSNTAVYTIACTNADLDAAWLGTLSTTFGKWKNLGALSSSSQACTACVATIDEISGLDRKSLSLVKEGEGLTQKLKTGRLSKADADQITRRLNDISKLLEANWAKRNGLVNLYNSQLSSSNTQPRRVNTIPR